MVKNVSVVSWRELTGVNPFLQGGCTRLARRRFSTQCIVRVLNLNHLFVSDLAQILSKVGHSIGMVVFRELFVSRVNISLAGVGGQFEERVRVFLLLRARRLRAGSASGVFRAGSLLLLPGARIPIFQNPPQREAEDDKVIQAAEWAEDVWDEVEGKDEVDKCEDECRVRCF